MTERVRTGLRIPYELNTWLVLKANEQGISKNSLILQILWNYKDSESETQNCGNGSTSVSESDTFARCTPTR